MGNLCITALAIVAIILFRGGLASANKQDLDSVLRRNLAQNAEILYSAQPELSEQSSDGEKIYVLRLESGAIGVVRTLNTQWSGLFTTSFNWTRDNVKLRSFTDGLAIIPLWMDSRAEGDTPAYGYCAVATENPDIQTAKLFFYNSYSTDANPEIEMECFETVNGLMLFRIQLTPDAKKYGRDVYTWTDNFDLYRSEPAYSFSVHGYDAAGNAVAHTDRLIS